MEIKYPTTSAQPHRNQNLTQLFIFPSLLRMFFFELDAPRISVNLIRKMESVVLLKWLSYVLSKAA